MSRYLLSTYSVADADPGPPPSPEEMQAFMQPVIALEAEMDAAGAFVFGGALHGADAATTVRVAAGEAMLTDGPFAETKEHIAGFYIIEAPDLDAALKWGQKVAETIGHPIEVLPFRATGRVADHVAEMPSG